ncbi:MAG: tRNA (adenosine(37)-N6)-threonylcarbamoyltransferase complex ATPase subunit type 1 TsaE [Planctomycetales bacterium]
MDRLQHEVADESATCELAAALAARLPLRATVALDGTLGAGKTRFVQAVAEASGIDPKTVTSPTFMLIHEYQGDRAIHHFDAYRIKDDDEFLELGPDEYFERDGWNLIEWAERVADCLPRERLEIRITLTGPQGRSFEFVAMGKQYETLLNDLARWSAEQ